MEAIDKSAIIGKRDEDLQGAPIGEEHQGRDGRGVQNMASGIAARFTAADAVRVFNANFLDYDFSRLWVLKTLHPDGASCPGCGEIVPEKREGRFWQCKRVICGDCRKYFTALTGTFLSGGQQDFRTIILLAVLIGLGVRSGQISSIVGMSEDSIRIWRRKFMAPGVDNDLNGEMRKDGHCRP